MTTETEIREAIAAAASSVDGVKCSPWFRQTTKPGSAHVTYGRSFRDESGFGFMNVWQVLVVLPQDIAAAEKWIAAKGDALLEALGEPLVVTGMSPQRLALDTDSVPCVVIEGNRARE